MRERDDCAPDPDRVEEGKGIREKEREREREKQGHP